MSPMNSGSGPAVRGSIRLSASMRLPSAAAALRNCLYAMSRAMSTSRASSGERFARSSSSSSSSSCRRGRCGSSGTSAAAFMSSSVDATSTKSLATSRSSSPMDCTSRMYWSATSAIEMDPMSSFCRLTNCSSRSNGPEYACVLTLYDTYAPIMSVARFPAVASRYMPSGSKPRTDGSTYSTTRRMGMLYCWIL